MLETLKVFLPIAKKVLNKSSRMPVLQNICIRDNQIMITDIESFLVMPIDCNANGLVPLSLLETVLKTNLSEIDFSVLEEEGTFKYDNKVLKFKSLPAEEYPALPKKEWEYLGNWSKDIISAMNNLIPFCSKDELKPSLTGVYLSTETGKLEIAATSGHILKSFTNLGDFSKKYTTILPVKPIKLLKEIVDYEVLVFVSEGYMKFHFAGVDLYIRIEDGRFPDYKGVIPKEFSDSIVFNKKEFVKILKEADGFANITTHQIVVKPNLGELVITASDLEREVSWESKLGVKNSKELPAVGFNCRYLDEALSSFKEETLIWKVTTPINAQIIVESVSDTELNHLDSYGLIMPIRITE